MHIEKKQNLANNMFRNNCVHTQDKLAEYCSTSSTRKCTGERPCIRKTETLTDSEMRPCIEYNEKCTTSFGSKKQPHTVPSTPCMFDAHSLSTCVQVVEYMHNAKWDHCSVFVFLHTHIYTKYSVSFVHFNQMCWSSYVCCGAMQRWISFPHNTGSIAFTCKIQVYQRSRASQALWPSGSRR